MTAAIRIEELTKDRRPVGDVAVRHRIGYLPENPSFYDYLTAEELLKSAVRRATEISPERYVMELSLDQAPDRLLSELAAAGATLVSLNPMRDTLEDFFMQRVAEAGKGARAPLAEETRARR
jgi:ABC-type Na+ transport system ATPase subunit NatA